MADQTQINDPLVMFLVAQPVGAKNIIMILLSRVVNVFKTLQLLHGVVNDTLTLYVSTLSVDITVVSVLA